MYLNLFIYFKYFSTQITRAIELCTIWLIIYQCVEGPPVSCTGGQGSACAWVLPQYTAIK